MVHDFKPVATNLKIQEIHVVICNALLHGVLLLPKL